MRKIFAETTHELIEGNRDVIAVLGDIGVHSFRKTFELYPENIFNIGILEQAMIGFSAGLASQGKIPIVHTIAPFMVERALEQIKIDFGYQKLAGNLVTVGGSYDYAALGCTHHSPGDVSILSNIPEIEIYVPGSALELKKQLLENYNNEKLSYFRISETIHNQNLEISKLGSALVRSGQDVTILCIGPILGSVLTAMEGLNPTICYQASLNPIDLRLLHDSLNTTKLMIISSLYEGSVSPFILPLLSEKPIQVLEIGVPRKFLRNYGTASEHDLQNGLDSNSIKQRYLNFKEK